jgi:pimeloyl-ACP methyl ester carboxylesterase
VLALDDRGSGQPLVLVHGLATTRLIWRRAAPLLADGPPVEIVPAAGHIAMMDRPAEFAGALECVLARLSSP